VASSTLTRTCRNTSSAVNPGSAKVLEGLGIGAVLSCPIKRNVIRRCRICNQTAPRSAHSRQASRDRTQTASQRIVSTGIQDHKIEPTASILHLAQHQAGIHGFDFHVTLTLDTRFDGHKVVDAVGLQAMPRIIEEADRITSGRLDPAPEFLNGALQGFFVNVKVLDNIKANIAQCTRDELRNESSITSPEDRGYNNLVEQPLSTLPEIRAQTMLQYSPAIEAQMCAFYWSLSEKDRRRYAAIEARKLGRGGLSYIASVLGCDRQTIAQGMHELTDPDALDQVRIRHQGGGRKSSLEAIPELEAAFLHVLEHYTAGSPMNAEVKWTNLTYQEIADHLQEQDIQVRVTVVKQLLQKHHFVRRKAQKRTRAGECAQRDEPFANIAQHREAYAGSPNPILSIDTKKKS
jgi:hypothetical protein